MKKLNFPTIFLLLFTFSIFLFACNETELTDKSSVGRENPEDYIEMVQKRIKESNKQYKVEHSTLEEMNVVMRSHNLPEISQAEVDEAKLKLQARTTHLCSVWESFGDWNGDSTLNTLDLVAAQIWLCNNYGCGNSCSLYSCTPPHVDFAGLSYLLDGTGFFELGDEDLDAGRDYVLDIVICN